MIDDELPPPPSPPNGHSTRQLMLIVALFGVLFGFMVMTVPSAFHQDAESWGNYRVIAMGLVLFLIVVCVRRPRQDGSEWSKPGTEPGDRFS